MIAAAAVVCFVMLASLPRASAQQVSAQQAENHPTMWMQDCTNNGCTYARGEVVLDANWRWVNRDGQNCYMNDNSWNSGFCSDGETCAQNCGLDGADYLGTYGVSTNNYQDSLRLNFVTHGAYSNNYGSRLYYMDSSDTYKMFSLLNKEFSIDVDVSQLPCGLNGAVYFVEMDQRGDFNGQSNKAGAKYGTGYCDAQCPHDIKFIKGQANVVGWNRSNTPPVGRHGACCAEMDIWEANSRSTAFTPHPCSKPGLTKCEGLECGDNWSGDRYNGICDKDGCDFNSFRLGDQGFYGQGVEFEVDTTRPFSVVTQFITSDGTDAGDLVEVKRMYVQDGEVIENSVATVLGGSAGNSITDDFCKLQKTTLDDPDDFTNKGGLKVMGDALRRGVVLVMSLWDDSDVNMLWLDSSYPADRPPRQAGVMRGPCPGGETSSPAYLRANEANSKVEFSNIKVGTIGSTLPAAAARRLGETLI